MCGIIAVVRRPSRREPPETEELLAGLTAAEDALPAAPGGDEGDEPDWSTLGAALDRAAGHLEAVDRSLRGTPGVERLLADPDLVAALADRVAALETTIAAHEQALDAAVDAAPVAELESLNAAMVRLKDAAWAVRRDRLRTAEAVGALAGGSPGPAALRAYTSVQAALSALDRLEVRGRDSAGVHLLVRGHGLDVAAPAVRERIEARTDPLFTSTAVRVSGDQLGFVYKAAAEIGELGDNTSAIRAAIAADDLLRDALAADTAEVVVLGHTRWASVGIVSEPNAHPLDHLEVGHDPAQAGPYVTAALNGDVDNHAELRESESLTIAEAITTDAKVIPTMVSRRVAAGTDPDEAFRETVALLEGSVAIGASASDAPGRLMLALRGSGQALYVGLAEDTYIVASEPYGVVEETPTYLRMDGETAASADNPTGSRGQVVVLDGAEAGTLAGITRRGYDGTDLPVTDDDLQTAEITTRDIDRGDVDHYLLKEISEAPRSFRKTLRGKIRSGPDGRLTTALGTEVVPPEVGDRLRAGEISRVLVIGQGTAAVAGQAVAAAIDGAIAHTGVAVRALPATELSGFEMVDEMADTLVVAISQSGTTTDTNRTVDLVRGRGATVLAIVNRRNSDLAEKADGVLYTSDGRDVEMSVASTKAFYAQVAAGFLLAAELGALAGGHDGAATHELLVGLRALPDAMDQVLAQRDTIAAIAQRTAPHRRYWAVVGNGRNRIAAAEIRIKLSELCYKSIACDATEDKKHIDLSAEPLILVCAAGLTGSTAGDVAKEVAIYRAHKALPVVIATDDEARFDGADVIGVPGAHPAMGFVLSAMAGHLYGYEAALAIDATARPLREARAAIEAVLAGPVAPHRVLDEVASDLEASTGQFLTALRSGAYDGSLEASTAVRLGSLLRYASGITPLDSYQIEHGRVGSPAVVVDDLSAALTRAIEELTRPVDAIKHQAKTVTVGISRADEELLTVPLVRELLAAGATRDRLGYGTLRTVAELDPAVAEVAGFTRYQLDGDPTTDTATLQVLDKGGVAAGLRSRTETDPRLRGTKQLVAVERLVTVARGRSDDRTVILVPEVKDKHTTGLVLLHVRFHDRMAPATLRGVLRGYRNREAALRGAVTETESDFDEAVLGELPVADVLTQPVYVLAENWRDR